MTNVLAQRAGGPNISRKRWVLTPPWSLGFGWYWLR